MFNKPYTAPHGITLVEMMIVVSIVGLIVAMLGTTLSDVRQRMRMNEATNTVANMLMQARSRAIEDQTIYHVRIENNPPPFRRDEDGELTDEISTMAPPTQFVSIWQFAKTADALKATTEEAVWMSLVSSDSFNLRNGWNPYGVFHEHFTNRLVERQPLPLGTWFETEYKPEILFDDKFNKLRSREVIHVKNLLDPNSSTLYYSGIYDEDALFDLDLPLELEPAPLFYMESTGMNALPKEAAYDAAGNLLGEPEPYLLFFYPDGTASTNLVILIRDKMQLGFVQVLRSGKVRTGVLLNKSDFKQLQF